MQKYIVNYFTISKHLFTFEPSNKEIIRKRLTILMKNYNLNSYNMKATALKVMLAIVAMLTVTDISAASKKSIYNNDTIENGKVVAREICAEDNGVMTLVSRSEMSYTSDGKIAEKRDYSWNASESKWAFQRSYTYSYDAAGFVITMLDAQGNTKTFEYRE